MNAETVAAKLASSRPGYELVSYGEVGLPFYRIAIKAHVLEHKRIGPFAEFALRAVNAGFDESGEVGALLGLSESVVETTLAGLVESEDLALRGGGSVALTQKGATTLETATAIVPEEATIEIDYDGLLRKPVAYIDQWLAPIDLKNVGIREIPPSPVRPPELRDIDIKAVDSIVRVLGDRRDAKRDLIAFRSLERRRRFQVALALVFRGDDPTDVQVAFVIDGILSHEHEAAFARSRYKRKLIGGDAISSADSVVEAVLGKALVKEARRAGHVERSAHTLEAEEDSQDEPADTIDGPRTEGEFQVPAEPLRMLETFEHPALLEEALRTSEDRLLIVSPWVRRSIVNKGFLAKIEDRLVAGVDVFIGWGISSVSDRDDDIDEDVLKAFERLAETYKWTFSFRRLGNTHAKVLISDRRFLVVTSFNWLSFRGDPRRTFRDERGTYVAMAEAIDQQFHDWAHRIRADAEALR